MGEKRPCRGICCSGSLPCSFLSCDHLVIMLGLPTLWVTNYRQARRRWRGQYRVFNRTWRLRLPLLGLFCGGTILLIPGHERQPALRRNPQLLLVGEGLLWKLQAKMRKWSAILCGIYNMFSCVSTGNIHDPAKGCLRGAIHDPAEGHLNKT